MSPIGSPIRYCTTRDHARIAFSAAGAGHPLVRTPCWFNHVEAERSSPLWAGAIGALEQRHLLVRYDARGCGMSQATEVIPTLASALDDLEAVIAASGIARFALFGMSQGAAVAIAYAARHPEAVSHLVLQGAFLRTPLGPHEAPEARLLAALARTGWHERGEAFRQVFGMRLLGSGASAGLHEFDRLQRLAADGETVASALAWMSTLDVTDDARAVRCPVLVLHGREDRHVDFAQGEALAGVLPRAEFVPLAGGAHLPVGDAVMTARVVAEIAAFFQRHPVHASVNGGIEISHLTSREREVLDLLAAGWANGQIAAHLGLAAKTVRNYVTQILEKLGIDSRGQAIVQARELGLGRV